MQHLTRKGLIESYWRDTFSQRSERERIDIVAREIYEESVRPSVIRQMAAWRQTIGLND